MIYAGFRHYIIQTGDSAKQTQGFLQTIFLFISDDRSHQFKITVTKSTSQLL